MNSRKRVPQTGFAEISKVAKDSPSLTPTVLILNTPELRLQLTHFLFDQNNGRVGVFCRNAEKQSWLHNAG